MKQEKQKQFFAGVPTDLDVKRLREKWPFDEMEIGDLIPYEDVEEVLGMDRKTYLFKTVTLTWRKKALNETPYVIGTERGVGFKVLNDSETADLSGNKLKYAAKSMRTSIFFAARVDTKNLTQEERARLQLNGDRASKALSTLQIKSTTQLPEMEPFTNNRRHIERKRA
jgi:hypothetical protein